MKKIILLLFSLGLIVIGGPIIGSATTQNTTDGNDLAQQWDRFNLLIPREAVYVKTAHQYGTQQAHGDYLYRQPAYRADGSHYEVVFQAPRALKPNHYLKLDAKGRFVNSWTVVSKSELPVKLQSSL